MAIFDWAKALWATLWKKDLVSQNKINPTIVKAFADKLDELIKFDKLFDGKFAWAEKYDGWVILQLLNLFISIVGDKLPAKFWISLEQTFIYYADGNYTQASYLFTKELNPSLNTFLPKGAQEIVLKHQIAQIFELANYYTQNEPVNA